MSDMASLDGSDSPTFEIPEQGSSTSTQPTQATTKRPKTATTSNKRKGMEETSSTHAVQPPRSKKETNRLAQQAARFKKQQYIIELETRLKVAEDIERKEDKFQHLRSIIGAVIEENRQLRKLAQTLAGFLTEGLPAVLPRMGMTNELYDAIILKGEHEAAIDAFNRTKEKIEKERREAAEAETTRKRKATSNSRATSKSSTPNPETAPSPSTAPQKSTNPPSSQPAPRPPTWSLATASQPIASTSQLPATSSHDPTHHPAPLPPAHSTHSNLDHPSFQFSPFSHPSQPPSSSIVMPSSNPGFNFLDPSSFTAQSPPPVPLGTDGLSIWHSGDALEFLATFPPTSSNNGLHHPPALANTPSAFPWSTTPSADFDFSSFLPRPSISPSEGSAQPDLVGSPSTFTIAPP